MQASALLRSPDAPALQPIDYQRNDCESETREPLRGRRQSMRWSEQDFPPPQPACTHPQIQPDARLGRRTNSWLAVFLSDGHASVRGGGGGPTIHWFEGRSVGPLQAPLAVDQIRSLRWTAHQPRMARETPPISSVVQGPPGAVRIRRPMRDGTRHTRAHAQMGKNGAARLTSRQRVLVSDVAPEKGVGRAGPPLAELGLTELGVGRIPAPTALLSPLRG